MFFATHGNNEQDHIIMVVDIVSKKKIQLNQKFSSVDHATSRVFYRDFLRIVVRISCERSYESFRKIIKNHLDHITGKLS